MFENMMEKKLEMYAMLLAIEDDLIICFLDKLHIDNIPCELNKKSKRTKKDISSYEKILRNLDLQSYIEIINSNIENLQVSLYEKDFINKHFARIIPIRNKVMHPRPLDLYDYPILKECFEVIASKVNFVEWNKVKITSKMILEEPHKLFDLKYPVKKSNNIIENLPTFINYEETSFIGRNKESAKVREMLYKSNVHILTIVGDGGVGKTALALKILYDILDSNEPKFELIIWATLKTTELNKFEFRKIEDAIFNTAQLYDKLDEFVGTEDGLTTQEWIINLAKEFNTLFVLDNLETINTKEIKSFLDSFSEYGKVMITSRIGLGEMEHRFELDGLNDHDSLEYFDALLKLYGMEHLFNKEERLTIAKEKFHSNPLFIKWFVKGLYGGNSVEELLENKDTVINFCMSNVYEKLSDVARSILAIMTISTTDLSYAELMYYYDKTLKDDITIRKAINELVKCNFINHQKFQDNFILSITDFANEFLHLNSFTDSQMIGEYKQRQRQLAVFKQDMLTQNNVNPYSMKAFSFINNDISRVIAAYYLLKAIRYANKNDYKTAFEFVEFAKKLAPKYFECNKISAFLNATINPQKAKEEYELALTYCENNTELATVHVLYAGYFLRIDDYSNALIQLNNAQELDNKTPYIRLEKTKIYACTGEFDKAEKTISEIDCKSLSTTREENIYLTRKADILKRKSEKFQTRDYARKFSLLSQAMTILESSERPDDGIFNYMAVILKEVSYMYFDNNKVHYLTEKLEDNIQGIIGVSKFKTLKEAIYKNLDLIESSEMQTRLKKTVIDFDDILPELNENEGIVCSCSEVENYGFIKNLDYPKGIYFRKSDAVENISFGDIISMEVLKTEKGPIAKNLQLLYNMKDII